MAKLNITMDDRLVEKIDEYAENNFMTRSGLIGLCCNQFLTQQEAYGLIKRMAVTLDKIAEQGSVDINTRAELDDFHRICKLLTGR